MNSPFFIPVIFEAGENPREAGGDTEEGRIVGGEDRRGKFLFLSGFSFCCRRRLSSQFPDANWQKSPARQGGKAFVCTQTDCSSFVKRMVAGMGMFSPPFLPPPPVPSAARPLLLDAV